MHSARAEERGHDLGLDSRPPVRKGRRRRGTRDWLLHLPSAPAAELCVLEPLAPLWELAPARGRDPSLVLELEGEDWDERLERLARAAQPAPGLAAQIAALTRAIERDPANPRPWTRRGIVRARAGQLTDAVVDYTRAIEVRADYLPAWANRASAHFHLGAHEAATRDATRAIELKPDLPLAWLFRGLARARLRQVRGAEEDLLRHLALAPYSRHLPLIRSVLREVADWDERGTLAAAVGSAAAAS